MIMIMMIMIMMMIMSQQILLKVAVWLYFESVLKLLGGEVDDIIFHILYVLGVNIRKRTFLSEW